MGLFGGFEKLERKGDEALERAQTLDAYRHFRDAHKKALKKDPAAAYRLQDKASRVRQRFIEEKVAEAREYLTDEVADAAIESLQIAREYLEESEVRLGGEIDKLWQQARQLVEPDAGPEKLEDFARAEVAAGMPAGAIGPHRAIEEEPEGFESSDEELLQQALCILSPEDQERAEQLGETFQRGLLAHSEGRTREARKAFEQARGQHSGDPLVNEFLALSLDQLGETAAARKRYEEVLALAPRRINARLALASILSGVDVSAGVRPFMRWFLAARAALEKRGAKSSDRGARSSDRGAKPPDRESPALAVLKEGTSLDPQKADVYWTAAAELQLGQAHPGEAAGLITRAMETAGQQRPNLWHLYAVTQEVQGSLDEAQEAYDKATRFGGQAMFYRAEFAEFALRHKRALKEAGEIIFETCIGCQGLQASQEEIDYYGFLLTRIQHAQGEYNEALKGIDRLLAQGPAEVLERELRKLKEHVVEEKRAAEYVDPGRAEGSDEEP